MSIDQWWPRLSVTTQQWLINNNGDELPVAVATEITDSGYPTPPGAPLPDDLVDWIEALANGEPSAPS